MAKTVLRIKYKKLSNLSNILFYEYFKFKILIKLNILIKLYILYYLHNNINIIGT